MNYFFKNTYMMYIRESNQKINKNEKNNNVSLCLCFIIM